MFLIDYTSFYAKILKKNSFIRLRDLLTDFDYRAL